MFSLELSSCDGSDPVIMSQMYCLVPITTLRSTPFSLPWGSTIVAKVMARNLYGPSGLSVETPSNQQATILTIPDAPKELAEVLASKTTTSIGLSWTNGDSNGGATVTSYTISYSTGGAFTVLQSEVTSASYTATGLTTGTTYSFKIQSSNSFGISDYSSSFSVLCAFVPVAPLAPTTSVSTSNVVITWNAPSSNGGSPLTSYSIYIRKADLSYSLETNYCDGSNTVILGAAICTIPFTTLRASPFNLILSNPVIAYVVATNIYGNSDPSPTG